MRLLAAVCVLVLTALPSALPAQDAKEASDTREAEDRRTLRTIVHDIEVDTQKLAAAHVRAVAVSLEVFAVARDSYPKTEFAPLDQVGELVPEFLPAHMDAGPWGETIYVWSNGVHYVVVSPGRDLRLDHNYEAMLFGVESGDHTWKLPFEKAACVGVNHDPDIDLVWANGAFCAEYK